MMDLSWFLVMFQVLLAQFGRCCLLWIPGYVGVCPSGCTCLGVLAVISIFAVVGWQFVVFDVFYVLGGCWMCCSWWLLDALFCGF